MDQPVWINSGELSGEMHGAALAKALLSHDPSLSLIGMGGSMMEDAGVDLHFHIDELSIMGFTEVITQIPRIIGLLSRIRKKMEEVKPRALIVIDAPDFHFRVINIAKSLGIPVYYYISPKIWAWRQNRAFFIKQNVRKLISILPFEVSFYQRFDMQIDYVGSPLVDMVNYKAIQNIQPEPLTVGLLPGSRKSEIQSLMPVFGESARLLLEKIPTLSFCCICAPNIAESALRALWPAKIPLSIISAGNRWAVMRQCRLLMAASGTATLESAIAGVPTLVTYKLSVISYFFGKMLIKVPYISLANLIAEEEVFPELIQDQCNAANLCQKALAWLEDDQSTYVLGEKLQMIRDRLGPCGAVERAAAIILNDIP